MTAPLSLTAGFALSTQKVKGTAASTTFIRGLMASSGANERYDVTQAANEHTGIHRRPTVQQVQPIRSGVVVDWAANFPLYPDMIGHMLRISGFEDVAEAKGTVTGTAEVQTITLTAITDGTFRVGFMGEWTAAVAHDVSNADLKTALDALSNIAPGDVVVSGTPGSSYVLTMAATYINKNIPMFQVDGTELIGTGIAIVETTPVAGDYYEHIFRPCKQGAQAWGTILTALGEGGQRFERKVTDCRASQVEFTAARTGINVVASGLGITMAAAAGTETQTAETDVLLSQTTGSLSFKVSSVELVSGCRSHVLTIAQALADDDQYIHSFTRGDFPVTGLNVTGSLRDVDISYNLYKKLRWGGTAGTGPVVAIPNADITYSWASPANIGVGAAYPYLFEVDIPAALLTLSNFQASGADLVRCNIDYQMLDNATTEPITIKLRNLKVGYEGS
jgi:hypothetical protein